MPAALWEWNYIGWALMASGSTGKLPGALPITPLTSMVPKAFSHVPQALASVSVMSPRYLAGMYTLWWSRQLLRQGWSLPSVQKKYIQVQQVMTLYLKLTLNSICELRLGALTLICCVVRSTRIWIPTSWRQILASGDPKRLWNCDAFLFDLETLCLPSPSLLLQKKDKLFAA